MKRGRFTEEQLSRCQTKDRLLARGIQLRTAPQQSGLPNAQRVRRNPEILSYEWLRNSRQVRLAKEECQRWF
jgi:hypothetical protein